MRRRSTVHDATSLKLHPDGTRMPSRGQNTLAAGGNAIASDVGGRLLVRKKRKHATVERVQEGMTSIAEHQIDAISSGELSTGSIDRMKDPRARKRRRYNADLDFLAPLPPPSDPTDTTLPSSDLLKTIHYFAARYFSARGQLSALSAEAKRERKARRLRRLEQKIRATHGDEVLQEVNAQMQREMDEDRNLEGNEEDEPTAARSGRYSGTSKHGDLEASPPLPHHKGLVKDLYKGFDGSALMAIGILLQEHIRHSVIGHSQMEENEDDEGLVSQVRRGPSEEHASSALSGNIDKGNLEPSVDEESSE